MFSAHTYRGVLERIVADHEKARVADPAQDALKAGARVIPIDDAPTEDLSDHVPFGTPLVWAKLKN